MFPRVLPGAAVRLAGAALLAGGAGVALADGLSFDRALRLALTGAPSLQAARASLDGARHGLLPAGALPDPQLSLGLDNLPVEGRDRYEVGADPMTMRRVALTQAFPSRAKRQARVAVAQGDVAISGEQVQLARRAVAQETAAAWVGYHTAQRQLAQLDSLRAENRLLQAAVRARLAGGQGSAADVLAPRREAAEIDTLQDRLEARRDQAAAELARWVGGEAPATPVGDPPDWRPDQAALLANLAQLPQVAVYDARVDRAQAAVALAQADRRPDWALTAAYQARGRQFGDMVMLEVSFDLPLFTARRQDPRIAARAAMRVAATARREAALREQRAALEAGLAEYRRLDRAVARQGRVLLPLSQQKAALALAAWQGGQGSLADLVAARRERLDAELALIDLEGERRQLAVRLHYGYGDDPVVEEQP